MKIKDCLNITPEEVKSKKHNIWIGVSLGNRYFAKENTKQYIEWALEHTKDKVLIVVVDDIYAINLEVLDSRSFESARSRALKLGNEKYREIEEILQKLSNSNKEKISLVHWKNIADTNEYKDRYRLVRNEFESNKEFHDEVINIIKAGRSDRADRISQLSVKEMDRLAEYILKEIPLFVDGIQGSDSTIYTLIPYPGLTKLDELFIDLNTNTRYTELAQNLKIGNKIATVEVYPD